VAPLDRDDMQEGNAMQHSDRGILRHTWLDRLLITTFVELYPTIGIPALFSALFIREV